MTKVKDQDHLNFYTLLGCEINAPHEQLKEHYQKLARSHHPDKQAETKGSGQREHEQFVNIDKAWKVLRDVNLRREYDATMLQKGLSEHLLMHAELRRDEITFNSKFESLYPCRCGSNFTIHKDYLQEETECIIECNECSNCIVIK